MNLNKDYHSSNIPNHVREQIFAVIDWLRKRDSELFSQQDASEYDTVDPFEDSEGVYRVPSTDYVFYSLKPDTILKVIFNGTLYHCFSYPRTTKHLAFVTNLPNSRPEENEMTPVEEWLSVASKVI
jgi:hypothetical protein